MEPLALAPTLQSIRVFKTSSREGVIPVHRQPTEKQVLTVVVPLPRLVHHHAAKTAKLAPRVVKLRQRHAPFVELLLAA